MLSLALDFSFWLPLVSLPRSAENARSLFLVVEAVLKLKGGRRSRLETGDCDMPDSRGGTFCFLKKWRTVFMAGHVRHLSNKVNANRPRDTL